MGWQPRSWFDWQGSMYRWHADMLISFDTVKYVHRSSRPTLVLSPLIFPLIVRNESAGYLAIKDLALCSMPLST